MKEILTPTNKQINFVNQITHALGIEFPTCSKEFTRKAYSNFISIHLDEYNTEDDPVDLDWLHWVGAYENDAWTEYY